MTRPQPSYSPRIRTSTDADIEFIHAWLQQQHQDNIPGTFMCNWNLTLKQHARGDLLVYVDQETGEPVAYQWGGLLQPGILEVRNDLRGRGIGRTLVAHRLAQAYASGEDILHIECTPDSSIPFWTAMGFTLVDGSSEAYAFIDRTLRLPEGDEVSATVEWYPESRKWEPSTPAKASKRLRAVRVGGEVFLPERVLCLERVEGRDTVLRVAVEGVEWFLDKAKYEGAERLGVRRCSNGFYVDVLTRPEHLAA